MGSYDLTVTQERGQWLGECIQVPAAHTGGPSLEAMGVIILVVVLAGGTRIQVRFGAGSVGLAQ
ncbi:MAG: hypothetical protein WAS54_02440 [Scrofimicrobium sp.]